MSFEALMGASLRLAASVETLAAIGAELRLRRDGLDGDPRLRAPAGHHACRRTATARPCRCRPGGHCPRLHCGQLSPGAGSAGTSGVRARMDL
jgi:hypothetical protein